MACTVPFIEKALNSTYQRLQDFRNLKDVERILKREVAKGKNKPFIPSGFTGIELMSKGLNLKFYQWLNPSVPDAPNWRILLFEKRVHETETS